MSSQQSNDALSVADASLSKDLARIKHYQADGRVVVDKAHDIAKLVSQALQQHGRNASVIPPLLLSAAAKVQATMNVSQAPQWERVRDNDSHMNSHPFFAKTKGFATPAVVPVPSPTPVLVPPPAPKVMSAPPIDSLPAEAAKPTANKGKQPVRGTRRAREDDSDDGSRKKRKVSRVVSKALISDTEDEDGQPSRTIIVAKSLTALQPSKAAVPQTPAPTKKVKQVDTKVRKGQPMPKGKGKEKEVVEEEQEEEAVAIAVGDKYDPPCARCGDNYPCLASLSRKGRLIQACGRCYGMKVRCERKVTDKLPEMAEPVQPSCPRSKSTPASKSKPKSRLTRAASRACPPTPVVESEDSVDDTDVAVDQDIVMSHVADTERQTDVAAVTPSETVNQLTAMASTNDFPADHWPEETNNIPIPPPPPPPPPPLAAELTVHECVAALVARVAAMIDAMEQDFDSRITSMRAEFTDVQLSFNQMVDVVTGLSNMVEKFRQEHSFPNPSFPPPVMVPTGGSTATAMGVKYLTGVFGPSLAPNADSQPSASRPFGRPDVQGSTFTSGQPSSESVEAGPSSGPTIPSDVSVSSPASVAPSLP
ncbi:hypothetical protein EV702DRAFT_1227857 [Suillus placidus]|uniref:Uncharacterized protein n=1 Tax=Suillus placidus TaxID=48579 RepID=A0A9P7D3A9_9AGAM|nr:hypothetical protein EV702DRAFT_1227857 [Suillus placidus]